MPPPRQFLHGDLPLLHTSGVRLDDDQTRRGGRIAVDGAEAGQRTQSVQHHLAVALGLNRNTGAVLVVADHDAAAADHDAVSGAEAVGRIFGVVHSGLQRHEGRCGKGHGLFLQRLHIKLCCLFHGGVVVRLRGELLQAGVVAPLADWLEKVAAGLVFRNGMSQTASLRVGAGRLGKQLLHFDVLRAVEPRVGCRCAQLRVDLRCRHQIRAPIPLSASTKGPICSVRSCVTACRPNC